MFIKARLNEVMETEFRTLLKSLTCHFGEALKTYRSKRVNVYVICFRLFKK